MFGATKIISPDDTEEKDCVVFFPDELPEDHRILGDVLRGVFAPFKVWRICALEYHRQGFDAQFEQLLSEIVAALDDPDIDKLYQERDKEEYNEGIIDIYVALAAKALSNYSQAKHNPQSVPLGMLDYNKKLAEFLKFVDDKQRLNEYTWLIRGFFQILQNDLKRAEDHFRYVHERALKSSAAVSKKKYLFGALVGLGIVSYAANKHDAALSYFVKAVQANPLAAGASVRTAIALCCFRLEQYDRARQALEKSIAVDPTNAGALVLLSLVEQATAKKDRAKRATCHTQAFEYCSLANAVDPGNPQTLNMLANHHFHSWRTLEFNSGGCFVVDSHHLMLPAPAAQDLVVPKNLLRIQQGPSSPASSTFIISAVTPMPEESDGVQYVTVEVIQRIPARFLSASGTPAPCATLEVKDLASVERYAHQAMLRTPLPAVLAESNYILGKVAHSLRDANLAFDFYWKALKDAPDMTLAAFGAAGILFARKEYATSLELFEKVLLKNPEDKDTQAYVMFLKATMHKEVAPFDKLREIAPGFQHEGDLWLLQGQLRQHDPAQHKHALKCFLNAKECIEKKASDGPGPASAVGVSPAILSNIAVLHHSLGNLSKAVEYSKLTLLAVHGEQLAKKKNDDEENGQREAVFRCSELEGVFYDWSPDPVCLLRPGSESNQFMISDGSAVDLSALLSVGDEVVIGGVKHSVQRVVSSSELICTSPVKVVASLVGDGVGVGLRVKRPFKNFVDGSITYCFNFARLMEEEGHTKAAMELYIELLKKHPSFMECYLRLSIICCDLGKYEEAAVWLSRALAVRDNEAEATLCLGDLYSRSGNLEDAKKCYDKVCNENRHDSKAMLALGNFYFTHHSGARADQQLKESYKFFYHVLNENNSNAFAANGLGMVCAKKGELDIARETFAKARESNMAMGEDICTNLAHVYLLQNRHVEAERLYQATAKSFARSGRAFSEKPAYMNECMASIQLKDHRFVAASRSVLRALHLNPANLRAWYNDAFIGRAHAARVLKIDSTTASEIEQAKQGALISKKVFKHLATIQHAPNTRLYDRKFAHTNYTECSSQLQDLQARLKVALARETAEESQKRRRDEDHNALLNSKSQQKQLEAQAAENEKLAKQQLAEQKERKLQELREKWTANIIEKAPARSKASKGDAAAVATEGGGKKRRRGQKHRDSDDSGDGAGRDDGEDEDEALMRALSGKSEIDFGSSEDDSEPAVRRELRPREAKPSSNLDDLFGDSDDDGPTAPARGEEEEEEDPAPSRKRLKRASGAANDSDDDMDFGDGDAQAAPSSTKQRRIADDESD